MYRLFCTDIHTHDSLKLELKEGAKWHKADPTAGSVIPDPKVGKNEVRRLGLRV
jgi:hypothetical protein